MTQATFFPTAHRNAVLQALVGKSVTLAAQSMGNLYSGATYIAMYSSPYGNPATIIGLSNLNAGNTARWGSAVAGTAPLSYSWNPNGVSATIVWARWTLNTSGTTLDGLVTTTGGGGMLIVPSTATGGVTVQCAGTLKQPFNNSGTLSVNGTLANSILSTIIYDTQIPLMGSGVMSIYGGTQPATADTPITNQTLLSNTHALTGASFASAAGGTIGLTAAVTATASSAVGTGTATWFRWVRGGNVMDGSVGTAGSGTDLIVASTTFTTGSTPPNITAFNLTVP